MDYLVMVSLLHQYANSLKNQINKQNDCSFKQYPSMSACLRFRSLIENRRLRKYTMWYLSDWVTSHCICVDVHENISNLNSVCFLVPRVIILRNMCTTNIYSQMISPSEGERDGRERERKGKISSSNKKNIKVLCAFWVTDAH